MAPLQVGSCVILRKKDWKHVVGVIQATVGKNEFMVHWKAPVEEGRLTGKYKKSQLMHGPPPNSPAPPPSSSPVSLNEKGSEDREDANPVTSVASLSSEDTDEFGNQCTRDVLRPDVISKYFAVSNTIDVSSQRRQHDLGLEKLWVTQNSWFRHRNGCH